MVTQILHTEYRESKQDIDVRSKWDQGCTAWALSDSDVNSKEFTIVNEQTGYISKAWIHW